MREVYNTDRMPPGQQFDRMRQAIEQLPMPLRVVGQPSTHLQAVVKIANLGQVGVTFLDSRSDRPLQLRRTHRLIRKSDPEEYRLVLSLHGRLTCQQGDHETRFKAEEVALFDTSQPLAWYRDGGTRPWQAFIVSVPRTALTGAARRAKPLLCRTLPVHRRLRVQLRCWLGEIVARKAIFEQIESEEGGALISLLNGLLAGEGDQGWFNSLTSEIVAMRAKSAILEDLGSLDMRPSRIAAAIGVSPRSLHKHVGATGQSTVMGLVSAYRLEQIYRDIIESSEDGASIASIGRRWGYPDPAHLNRSFFRRYRVNPGSLRPTRPGSDRGSQDGRR
ncbi:helix-turn-helix domain-containing protein [Solwaraspora sp. WMMB335]|uniref:helix-turn-helix domain-containing protein n=1 Tax=Solwaraspora sp. WMMB335 TaxID=3404118 RepID=UPI003B95C2A9